MAEKFVPAADLERIERLGSLVVTVEGETIVLFSHQGRIFAVDNRCPHMGFPLKRGTLKDGILTCHWHHARFDLASGGTFDQFADDVRAYPVVVRDNVIHVDIAPREDMLAHQRQRLREGLEQEIPLVVAKAVIALVDGGESPAEPFRIGLNFGVRYRREGWGRGLTMLTCMNNLLRFLDPGDHARALYQGLAAVANETLKQPPHFPIRPLPTSTTSFDVLKRWFRQFVEVRDWEGSQRCIVSALETGADAAAMSDLMFAAVTDHRYISLGHPLDFTNKAFEALDAAGWDYAAQTLTSLAAGYTWAERMEESNEWRHPVDLVAILERTFEELPGALEKGESVEPTWGGRKTLVEVVMGDDPEAIAAALIAALAAGGRPVEVAGAVAYAAALRVARFHISNEFADWDTALHTFTFANAVHQGLRRTPSPELVRGVFDAAMSVYLDRFLNIPATRLPEPNGRPVDPAGMLDELPALLDRQQQVNRAGDLVARYLFEGGPQDRLLATLGRLLLREDRDFHSIQMLDAALRQFGLIEDAGEQAIVAAAAARYLAAHFPTVRSQGQTYEIAARLARGEKLYEDTTVETAAEAKVSDGE